MKNKITMKKSIVAVVALWMVAAVGAMAQAGWNWPQPESKEQVARAKNARYTDSQSRGDFRDAANALYWLLVNAPDLNPSIYINGVVIYDKLAEAEADAAKKEVLQDSVLTLYDLRTKHFGDEAKNADYKAIYAYKYFISNAKRYPDLFEIMKKDADLNKGDMYWTNAGGIMAVFHSNMTVKPELLTDEEVLQYYEYINQSLDKAAKDEALKGYKDYIDKYKISSTDYLAKILGDRLSCEFVESKFGKRFDANPNDLKTAKDLYKMLQLGKCTDSPYYLKSLEAIYANEKTFEMADYLATYFIRQGNTAKGNEYLNQAISLAKTGEEKASLTLTKAGLAARAGRKSEARSLAYEAVQANSALAGKAYSFIGDLYMGATECYKKESIVEDRFIFLAAYDMYQKAGDNSGMAKAQRQFPSKEEIFEWEKAQVGESVSIGCWIGGSSVLRTRD